MHLNGVSVTQLAAVFIIGLDPLAFLRFLLTEISQKKDKWRSEGHSRGALMQSH